jgi:hypothetical protein
MLLKAPAVPAKSTAAEGAQLGRVDESWLVKYKHDLSYNMLDPRIANIHLRLDVEYVSKSDC